jgi:hypothetical protein
VENSSDPSKLPLMGVNSGDTPVSPLLTLQKIKIKIKNIISGNVKSPLFGPNNGDSQGRH